VSKLIWTSPYPPLAPDDRTLPELLRGHPSDQPAFVDGENGAMIGYGALEQRIDRMVRDPRLRGVVALWAPNSPEWALAALGAMAAGAAVTGIPPGVTEREAAVQLSDAGARLLMREPPAGEPLAGARETEPGLALLPYSSGTTGLPKGVMLTHGNLVAAARQVGTGLGLGERDTVLAVAPFAHVMGFVVTLAAPLAAGATVVTMPRFDLAGALALVERHRVTVLAVPPPVMVALASAPVVDRFDLSSLELVVSGGAPLGADLQSAVARRLPHAAIGQGYGLTETAVGITMPDRRSGTVPGSVGRVMPSTELRVVDPATGRDLGAGGRGELWVRGPQVMAGYLDRPDATAEVLDADGWLRTGDLGSIDAAGNVFVHDRLKELIKVNAHQVAPAELEALLMTHPDVADAAVVRRPDARCGEVPVAVVVPRGALDSRALIAWAAERTAPYKRLADVRVAERIPRTPAGKIMRRRLAATADR
jgi:acyl-CoA synthetase (AMP-forming)/AMP-acid ligase II